MARQWELEHRADFFWGSTGKHCNTAAWTHHVLAAYASYKGVEMASLFTDLKSFMSTSATNSSWTKLAPQGFHPPS